MTEPTMPDSRRVEAFAARLAELTPDAWDRINTRCALLDASGVEAFVSRLELYARSMSEPDPYRDPMPRGALSMIGRAFGLVQEIGARLGSSEELERAPAMPGVSDFMKVSAAAQRQQREHPGTASALRAVLHGLAWQQKSIGPGFKTIYQPFEPEIPLDSLEPAQPAA